MASLKRVRHLQRKLIKEKLSAFLVTESHNIYYLTGFRGLIPEYRESLLVVDRKMATLFVSRMYRAEAKQVRNVKIRTNSARTKLFDDAIKHLRGYRGKIGFESENLKYSEYQYLKKELKKLYAKKSFVSDLRVVKDDTELENIKKAVRITDQAFEGILRFLKPNVREKQVARKLIEIMEDLGAEGPSFYPIVASGAGSALPHYKTTNKKIRRNEAVLLDFGARVRGYSSDLTRVVYIGRAPKRFREHYEKVLQAQKAPIEAAKSGLKAEKLHQIALETLGNDAKLMLHGVGHGIGLEVHEKPFLRTGTKDKLETDMVVTIEPGLYYEGKYGIRLEDLGLVTNSGLQVLSKAPKDLIEL